MNETTNVLDDLMARYAHPNPTGAVGRVVDQAGIINSQQLIWLKQCRVCCDHKTLDAYSKDRSKADGLRNTCKQCDNMLRQERGYAHKAIKAERKKDND